MTATDNARLLNLGKTITLRSIGEVTVKELVALQVLKFAPEVAHLLVDYLPNLAESKDKGLEIFADLLAQDDTARLLCKIASASTGVSVEDIEKCSLGDWADLIEAFFEVNSVEEITKVFQRMMTKVQQQTPEV